MDVAISGDRNVIKKECKKILKYTRKYLTIELQRMWNVKTKVIPVIIGAIGTISKSFIKYVSNIPGGHEAKQLQKTAIIGTAHINRKYLFKSTMNNNNRIAATLLPRDIVCLRNISINTLHKEQIMMMMMIIKIIIS